MPSVELDVAAKQKNIKIARIALRYMGQVPDPNTAGLTHARATISIDLNLSGSTRAYAAMVGIETLCWLSHLSGEDAQAIQDAAFWELVREDLYPVASADEDFVDSLKQFLESLPHPVKRPVVFSYNEEVVQIDHDATYMRIIESLFTALGSNHELFQATVNNFLEVMAADMPSAQQEAVVAHAEQLISQVDD